MKKYMSIMRNLIREYRKLSIKDIPREANNLAGFLNKLALRAACPKDVRLMKRSLNSVVEN